MHTIILSVTAENAEAILDGKRRFDHRTKPPKRLPATAYLAVSREAGVVGQCEVGVPERRTDAGWALPLSRAKRYRRPRPLSAFGIARKPRSFCYLKE
jgi:predicted transcriptional regulator